MWNAKDLAMARMQYAQTLMTSCVIKRQGVAGTQDALGGIEFVTHSETTVCRVDAFRSAREIAQGGQVVASADHAVLLPFGTDVSVKDSIFVDGVRFEVAGVNSGSDRFCEMASCVRKG